MIDLAIPGRGHLRLSEVVLDYKGTLARDGPMLDQARRLLPRLAAELRVHVLTWDTFGTAQKELSGFPCALTLMLAEDQAQAKLELIQRLGAHHVVAVGNGRNDRLMLRAAALGIGVIGDEGIAVEALKEADVIARHIVDAFELLLHPRRLLADAS